MTRKQQEEDFRESSTLWKILSRLLITLFALIMGGRIQTLPSGRIRVTFFKWQYFLLSIILTTFCLFIMVNQLFSFNGFKWNDIDQNDEEHIFLPFTSRKLPAKFRNYIHNQPSSSIHHSQLYHPRNCPHTQTLCAKPVPSFILAGSEFSGASYVFQKLKQHPQVYDSVDNSNYMTAKHVFDDESFDEASAFDSYISQFPFITNQQDIVDKKKWIVGENAPHYLYQSHLTAKRIKDILPHVKLVFFLREPIARAYSQYLYEKPEIRDTKLSFEDLIELELPILRRCGHTSTQTGWEGFVRCHEGSEIRASWKVTNDTHSFNALAKGMYYPALIPFLQNFPASQLFIMRTEDILLNPSGTFQKLARFLNIDPEFFAERHFYKTSSLTEDELLSNKELTNISALPINQYQHHHIHQHHPYQHQKPDTSFKQRQHLLRIDEPKLSIRYRLQKVYKHINNRLIELFDRSTAYFQPWVYDVDRG